jgi:hypothetical protein
LYSSLAPFIDAHRVSYGVESISRPLPIAPSTDCEHKARTVAPERLPARAQCDLALKPGIRRVWDEYFQVYGARKVWRQLNRGQIPVGTVERLMGVPGLEARCGARPARPSSRTLPLNGLPTSCNTRVSSGLAEGKTPRMLHPAVISYR